MKQEELNFEQEQFTQTMIPGKFAKAMRTCVVWQLVRFAILNVKMIIVVQKSH